MKIRYCPMPWCVMTFLAALPLATKLQAQPQTPSSEPAPIQAPSMTGRLVDSRRGFVMRVPDVAVLDSAHSGWNPQMHYEVRSYILPDAGLIRVTSTVRATQYPPDTVNTGAYIYTQSDSATSRGTAKIRTYFLPTRHVRIEIIPFSLKGHVFTEEETAEKIFSSFRWKPGATSDQTEVD